ncbi:L,D-transpeptidase [Bifidobacterium amazonense]|uniref:L,D-transpeptidase n=1 Tax=Bifidobacterium amazonense TaxID=2809027 RepID=A0ABS9VTX3_9BIFI|nr:L,D-transpeptidase [Bifidobacterium amazonense]MCH9275255.1 L,D-transpeptidase [Bifidobacterium amazonense]
MSNNNGQSNNGFPQRGNTGAGSMAFAADGESTAVLRPISLDSFAAPMSADEIRSIERAPRRRLVWPWVLAAIIAMLAAVAGGAYWFFQSHALPGVTLWGNSVVGKSQSQIADDIDAAVAKSSVTVSYNGNTAKITLKDLGLSVDSQAIANEVLSAKRDDAWWQRYAFWITKDVSTEPANPAAADSSELNSRLSISEVKPVDAQVTLNADKNGFETVAGQQGQGADPEPVAKAAVALVETLGANESKTMNVELKSTDPAVTDKIAEQAKATLDKLVKNPVTLKIGDHTIATLDANALAAASTVNANENAKLATGETRDGYVVFSADKLQQYYENSIKPTFNTKREDREVIVNNNDEEIKVLKEGHDGISITDGADANIGTDGATLLANGGGSLDVQGSIDAMKTKTTKRHVVVDLSDNKVYAYENGKLIRTMSMSAGQGNDRKTGECTGQDLCTPTGDFTIWLKYESQDMSGNLTLSDGSTESWDVKGVGYVNYFSHTGCAIHRIATKTAMNDAQVAALGNTSHGCVGIGWDQAEWFYNWAVYGTSVHVQV